MKANGQCTAAVSAVGAGYAYQKLVSVCLLIGNSLGTIKVSQSLRLSLGPDALAGKFSGDSLH